MDPELKKEWLAALRGGGYKQGTGQLRHTVPYDGRYAYCCLGVLCDLLTQRGTGRWDGEMFVMDQSESANYVPGNILPECNASLNIQNELAMKNDSGKTFAEIADFIEESNI